MGRMSDQHINTAPDRADDAERDAAYWRDRAERAEAERGKLREALREALDYVPEHRLIYEIARNLLDLTPQPESDPR